jgi:triphosphoribosyl-dephospho-CoA synthase
MILDSRDSGAQALSAGLRSAADVVAAAQLACLLEASAAKPGNVSPGQPFSDSRYEDYLASAAAIGSALSGSATHSLGSTVRLAVEATGHWTFSNTNLGIVLLLAPLARAALLTLGAPGAASGLNAPALRATLRRVLEATSVEDASNVYEAIRQAAPGGLGEVPEQDVAHEPSVTLYEVMQMAASRDGVAREYATAFETTFEHGVPALERARGDGLSWHDSVVELFLRLLAHAPDTHIARRAGRDRAFAVTESAALAVEAGGVRSAEGRHAVQALDRELRDSQHLTNPGTTADLTTASIFVVLLCGGWQARSA